MSADTRRVERLSTTPEVEFPGEWYDLTAIDHFWFQWRLAAALRQWRDCGLALEAPLRVLDVGGGQGVFRDQVEGATGWTVDLVDLNGPALEAARPGRGRHLYYDVEDGSPGLLGAYDAAILNDVIEHLLDPQPLLRAVARHLKPGGWLLVNVPALQSLFSAYDVAAGHHRRYDRRTLPAELPTTEWDVRDVRYWGLKPRTAAGRPQDAAAQPHAGHDRPRFPASRTPRACRTAGAHEGRDVRAGANADRHVRADGRAAHGLAASSPTPLRVRRRQAPRLLERPPQHELDLRVQAIASRRRVRSRR